MDRRKLIASAASLCAAAAAQGQQAPASKPKPRSKITVLKRELYADINEKYRNGRAKRCDVFKDGQEFEVASPYRPPEGFCEWAWADIRSYIHAVHSGNARPQIGCCTDGVRPVVFKIEKIS